MYRYKGISFSKELNCSLENFKKMFASNPNFLNVPHNKRDAELKKVHKQLMDYNGYNIRVSAKSKESKAKQDKE